MKTTMSIILLYFLIMFSQITYALPSKTVTVTSQFNTLSLKAEESFTQTIGLKNAIGIVKGIQAYKFVVNYDSRSFHCVVAPYNSEKFQNELTITKSENKIVVVYLSSTAEKPISEMGDLVVFTFTATKYALQGNYEFLLSTGNTENFIDCDLSVEQRYIKPIMPLNALQVIHIEGNLSDKEKTIFSISDSITSKQILSTTEEISTTIVSVAEESIIYSSDNSLDSGNGISHTQKQDDKSNILLGILVLLLIAIVFFVINVFKNKRKNIY